MSCWLVCVLVGCGPSVPLERIQEPLPVDVEVASCERGKYGGRIVMGIEEPKTFNFLVSTDVYSSKVIGFMMNSLVSYHPIKEVFVPGLAKSWTLSEDKQTYTFTLREGLRWSDGHPLTADDVIFTLDAIFDPRYPSRYVDQLTMSGEPLRYRKIDARTVELTTPFPYAPFLNDVGGIPIFPRHILLRAFEDGTLLSSWSLQTAIQHPEQLVASGPFVMRTCKPGERIVFEPNPHYYRADAARQRLPYVDRLILKFVKDPSAAITLFVTGQSDVIQVGPATYQWAKDLQKSRQFTLHASGLDGGITFLWFNLNPGLASNGKPYVEPHKLRWFQDRRFRQAIIHAIDRQGMVDALFFGKGEPLHSIISPANGKWHNPHTQRYEYDVEKAKSLLREAGFVHGDSGLVDGFGNVVSIRLLLTPSSPAMTTMVVTLVNNLRAIGIHLEVSYVDFGTLLERIHGSFDYDLSAMGFSGGGDPSGGKAIYRSSGDLHVWYPNQPKPATDWEARIDALMDEQERTMDEAERIRLVHAMQSILSEELPLLFLFTPETYVGISHKWHNTQIAPMGEVLWNIDEWYTF